MSQIYKAELVWFDVNSGEGIVNCDGQHMLLHYTCIKSIAKNGYIAPTESDKIILSTLNPGDTCQVTIYKNLYSRRIETCEFDVN